MAAQKEDENTGNNDGKTNENEKNPKAANTLQTHEPQASQSTVNSESQSGKSHKSGHSNSLQVLDHEPVAMSEDEGDEEEVNLSPTKKLAIMNNDSSKDLQIFDSALDNSMVLDKEINTTLERSRQNSPKKKNNDNATTRTFEETEDASTVTGTGVTNTENEATPAPEERDHQQVLRSPPNASVTYAQRVAAAARQQRQQQQQQQQQQQLQQRGQQPQAYQMNQYQMQQMQQMQQQAQMGYGRYPQQQLTPNPNHYMQNTPGNHGMNPMIMQGETRTNGNDDSIISSIANNLRDPNVQMAIVGASIACFVGYIVYKQIKKNREQVNQIARSVGEASADYLERANRRRRSLSAYHNFN